MSNRKMASQFRFVFTRSSRMTKLVICAAIIVSVATILVLRSAKLEAQEQAELWREKAQQLEQENKKLEDKIDKLGTAEGIQDIAKDELGMEDPDTVIIEPEN